MPDSRKRTPRSAAPTNRRLVIVETDDLLSLSTHESGRHSLVSARRCSRQETIPPPIVPADDEPYAEFDLRPTEDLLFAPRDTDPARCASFLDAMSHQCLTVLPNGAVAYKSILGDAKTDMADSELFLKFCPFDCTCSVMDPALPIQASPDPLWCCKHGWLADQSGRIGLVDGSVAGRIYGPDGDVPFVFCPGCHAPVGELMKRRPR